MTLGINSEKTLNGRSRWLAGSAYTANDLVAVGTLGAEAVAVNHGELERIANLIARLK